MTACLACGHPESLQPFAEKAVVKRHPLGDVCVEGLSGLRCTNCTNIVFDGESLQRFAAAQPSKTPQTA